MAERFLGCLITYLPSDAVGMIRLPQEDIPVGNLIPPGTYAYYQFTTDSVDDDISNSTIISPVTFLGGSIHTLEELENEAIKSGSDLEIESLPGYTEQKLDQAKQFVLTKNNTLMPFFEGDILINIEE